MPQYDNAETFLNLAQAIDRMNFTPQEYDIILKIVTNYDTDLYIRILEEVSHGHMTWSDFMPVFKYDQDKFSEILNNQEKLFSQISYINNINKSLIDKLELKNLIISNQDNLDVNKNAERLEKENQILSMIQLDSDDPIIQFYNNAILKILIDGEADDDFVDKMLLSFHDYTVPVDYDHIVLNDLDRQYMLENHLTEAEMKKIKSLAAFSSNYYK